MASVEGQVGYSDSTFFNATPSVMCWGGQGLIEEEETGVQEQTKITLA